MPNPLRSCLAAAGLMLLAGCSPMSQSNASHEPAPKPPRVTSESEDACGANRVQDRIGRRYDDALGEAIRRESGAAMLRVMRPGEAHTLDYRADRLNVHLDEGGTITDIGCG